MSGMEERRGSGERKNKKSSRREDQNKKSSEREDRMHGFKVRCEILDAEEECGCREGMAITVISSMKLPVVEVPKERERGKNSA